MNTKPNPNRNPLDIQEPTPQDVSNFLFNAMIYVRERRPYEVHTIAILNELCFDVMDAEVGKQRALGVN